MTSYPDSIDRSTKTNPISATQYIHHSFMKTTPILLSLAVIGLSLAFSHADHHGDSKKKDFNPAGSWRAEAETDNGSRSFTFSFEKTKDGWAGKSVSEDGDSNAFDRIEVKGNTLVVERDIEANGQSGIIRVKAESSEDGAKLKGKWAIIDSAKEERMGGNFSATKVFVLDLAGEWDSVAMIGEEERPSKTTFKKDGEKWTGGFKSDEHDVKFSKVTTEGKDLTCEFVLEVDGAEREFRITAKAKSDDHLDGKWVVFNDSGEEAYSGQWTAKRKAAFDLAGTWNATTEINGESHASTVAFEKKGEGYTGSINSDAGSLELDSVKLNGEKVTLTFKFGEVDVTINAAAKDGKLTGKWSVTGDDGSEQSDAWVAVKK